MCGRGSSASTGRSKGSGLSIGTSQSNYDAPCLPFRPASDRYPVVRLGCRGALNYPVFFVALDPRPSANTEVFYAVGPVNSLPGTGTGLDNRLARRCDRSKRIRRYPEMWRSPSAVRWLGLKKRINEDNRRPPPPSRDNLRERTSGSGPVPVPRADQQAGVCLHRSIPSVSRMAWPGSNATVTQRPGQSPAMFVSDQG